MYGRIKEKKIDGTRKGRANDGGIELNIKSIVANHELGYIVHELLFAILFIELYSIYFVHLVVPEIAHHRVLSLLPFYYVYILIL